MSYKYLLSLVIMLSFFTTGCLTQQDKLMKKTEVKPAVSIYNKKWVLVNTDQSPYTAFIFFKDNGKVSGFSGCNTFFAKATISEINSSDNSITIGKLASTRKMCAYAMQFESNVVSKLSNITNYKITSLGNTEKLYLYQNKMQILTFTYQ